MDPERVETTALFRLMSTGGSTGGPVPPKPAVLGVVRTDAEFESLRDEWDRLAAISGARVYQTFDWQWLWWRHFGAGLELRLLTVRLQGELVGIAPFCIRTNKIGGISYRRCLSPVGGIARIRESSGRWVTYDPSDYLDIVVHPDHAASVAAAIAEYVSAEAGSFDALEFENVAAESALLRLLVPRLEESGFVIRASRSDICPYLPTPPSTGAWVQSLAPHVRRRIHQAEKGGGKDGLFTIENASGPEEAAAALRALVKLHQQRWNRLGYPGLFFGNRFEAFIGDIVNRLGERGLIWLKCAVSNGQTIAVRLGFHYNGAFYDYLSGYDEDAAASRRRPGIALLLSMISDASAARARRVDFLRGEEEYKFELTGLAAENWNITLSPRRSGRSFPFRGLLAGIDLAGRAWNRERLILSVHLLQHGLAAGITRYLRFRAERGMRKIRPAGAARRAKAGTGAST